jgi:NADPH2:quinone reductase
MKSSLLLPDRYAAAQIIAYNGSPESLQLTEKPMPQPEPGQVIVKMHAVPMNPSDLMFLKGLYGVVKPLPAVPGWEGCGTVVASGGGLIANWLVGKRVACASRVNGDGTWAEYLLTSAVRCIPLNNNVLDEQGATLIVNPLTAWALTDIARKSRVPAFVQTAAASALGRMIIRLSRKFGIPGIHVVRRQEQIEELRSLGAEHVLNSSEPDFDERLRELCGKLQAKIAFEAVSGETSARVLRAMPRGSRLILYGGLSESPCMADPRDLIFENKRMDGFFHADWLANRSVVSQLRLGRQIQSLLGAELQTEVRARFPLAQVRDALQMYTAQMTGGKVLIILGSS